MPPALPIARPPRPLPPPGEPDGGAAWALAAIASLCLFGWGAWSAWEDHARHLRWGAVVATVERIGPDDALRYRYRVAGTDHVGTRFHAIPLAGRHRQAEVLRGLRAGDRLTARFDPQRPSESFVSPGVSPAPFAVMAAAALGALLVFALWSRLGRRSLPERACRRPAPVDDDRPIERAA
jgi:hypothetical protein